MEEEAQKIKEMQSEVEKQMNITSPTTSPATGTWGLNFFSIPLVKFSKYQKTPLAKS